MSRPDTLVQAARTAEEAGFDSVWAGEHLVLPDPQVPPSPSAPQEPLLDSLLALTWAAAHTTTIRLATGIVILPQRNPKVSLCILDEQWPLTYLQVYGDATLEEDFGQAVDVLRQVIEGTPLGRLGDLLVDPRGEADLSRFALSHARFPC